MNTNKTYIFGLLVALLMLFPVKVSAQDTLQTLKVVNVADSIDIYLVTCEPHDEVYSLYGHTAIRVIDKVHGQDFVVNWGVFDTRASNFVIRFVFGLTDYMCAAVPTEVFKDEYRYYGSKVIQQHLALTGEEKKNLLDALMTNLRPENRVYRYNFFYDNCTTRARDIIFQSLKRKVKETSVPAIQKGDISFRQMIHQKNEGYPWAALGNDLLLGVQADFNTTHDEREFLPDVLMQDFNVTKIQDSDGMTSLVDSVSWLLEPCESMAEPMTGFPLTPTMCALIALLVVVVLTLLECYKLHRPLKYFDTILFYIYAIPGIILVAMIFSQHPTVRINLQILLFCPLWFWLKSPWTHWKHANKLSFIIIALFFLGNVIQSYAEGMNILALCLLLRIICCELKSRIYTNKTK